MTISAQARVAIALGTIALGLGLYTAVLEPKRVSSDVREARRGKIFDAASLYEVKKVDVAVGDAKLSIARTHGGWSSEPPIDASRVDALVSMLDRAQPVRFVDVSQLGPERARYQFAFANKTATLIVGAATELPSGGAYVRLEDRVMVVSRDVAQTLTQSPLELLETRAWEVDADVLRVVNVGPKGKLHRFERHRSGYFLPGRKRVSRKAVEDFDNAVLGLRVDRWIPAPVAFEGQLRAELETARERLTVELGGDCPGEPQSRLARVEGRYACVSRTVEDSIVGLANADIDRALFWTRRDEVERITLMTGGRVFEAARKDRGFRLILPAERELSRDESDALEEWLTKVLGMAGVAREKSKLQFESTVIVKNVDGNEERVSFLNDLASRDFDSVDRRFPIEAVSLVSSVDAPIDPRWIVPRELDATRVSIRCSPFAYEWRKESDQWTLVSPRGASGFESRFGEVIDALRRAKRGAPVQNSNKGLTCAVRLNDETFAFTSAAGHDEVTIKGQTFEVSAGLVALLSRDLVDPGCLLGDRHAETQSAIVSGRQVELQSEALIDLVDGARVARFGVIPDAPLATWGNKVTAAKRTDHGRIFLHCDNQAVTFSVDEAAFKRVLKLSNE